MDNSRPTDDGLATNRDPHDVTPSFRKHRSELADFGYIGSAFIATDEARATPEYKQAIVDCNSDDIVYSNLFTGVHGNYLAPSIRNAGLDPDNLPESDPSKMNFSSEATKAWKDIWGCGQGIGAVDRVQTTAELVARLKQQYAAARARLSL